MNSELTAYITLVCTSGVLNMYLFIYVFLNRHKYTSIGKVFSLYTFLITVYCFSSAFGLMSTNIEQIKLWTIIQYTAMPLSAPVGLLFIMYYLGFEMTRKKWIALLTIPIISLFMVATNDIHHLHYRVYEIDPLLGAPYVHQEMGVWYVVHGIYTFACMLFAFILVLTRWKETERVYRPQLISLLFGQFVPMATAFIYLIGLTPPGLDPVPIVLWLTSILYIWSISSSRLFTLMPIAKDAIFHSINDGVIVLDETKRLIEFNHASKRMFSKLNKKMYGLEFQDVWSSLSGGLVPFPLETEAFREVQLGEHIYQVRTTPLQQAKNSRGLLIIFTDITELKRLQIKLQHQADYDELTQIYNRRAFFQQSKKMLSEAKEKIKPFTVILMDIDYFKKVNDTYGHDAGDQLLKHVVKICTTLENKNILFARYGGEEFVFALKGSGGKSYAEELRQLVESQPLIIDDAKIYVTVSMGVARADKDENLNQLLQYADKALYAAKRDGRNSVKEYGIDAV
ncbi:histidine kinase N-terminal 7TM domain-containing diguanylate cyclase [Cytobacillus gottheilii]|uniref:histidine kinase N-terminal 7TM domain-containing diguanylate cyclase n=1 Tax=Cytobacillus gottheilii TaxID=859144 RepID=UPI0009BB0824|nr:histidine kinase N-terminal 7TM domain-containing protein [Cytobacillus gottheilii]